MKHTRNMLLISTWILGWLLVGWFDSIEVGEMRGGSFRGSEGNEVR